MENGRQTLEWTMATTTTLDGRLWLSSDMVDVEAAGHKPAVLSGG